MLYMNDYDIAYAYRRFHATPNRRYLTAVVANLMWCVNEMSDGWVYWKAPKLAARKAMEFIYSTTNAENRHQEEHDITDAEVQAALRPIKAFLTKHGVPYSKVIPNAKDKR